MARLQSAALERPLLRPRDLATLAALAVLVAGLIGYIEEFCRDAPAPPPLTMFQDSSLFATR